MTLQQRIEALEGDPVIHIGAASAFFFVGTRTEYEADIDAISDAFLTEAKSQLAKMQEDKHRFPLFVEELKALDPNTEDPIEIRRMRIMAQQLSAAVLKMLIALRNIPQKECYIENFIPLRERSCDDPYERFGNDGVFLIVEGTELGNYWNREEYQTKVGIDDEGGEEA